MGTNLFVGNLPFNATEQDLIDLFSEAGSVVSAQIVTDRETKRSRGFGFVNMADEDGAQAAIQRFHQADLRGRPLTVNEARPRAARSDRPSGGRWDS